MRLRIKVKLLTIVRLKYVLLSLKFTFLSCDIYGL